MMCSSLKVRQTQATAEVTTEVIVISIINNVTVTQTDRITTTQTVLSQTGDVTSTSGFSNLTSTIASTGTGAIHPNATATLLPVLGQATTIRKQYVWHVKIPLLAAAYALLG
ncbi:hypothetical protein PFICI_08464 [Pestalotiopsis fici W106-1]|uniref:Uncharacterized protein n=1 Tax=Pestalotiopsis fici (strain W106-1 / CGMCC3.15140) TaxID=1229662 RepID=W3X4E5_PESFW|nr:uncharacterized protein PFICI_08464 [Pestalotiopsis fici W106-1]ETS80935.1 hypothetical protein PFICI_08464 [Pestalotiopsis fici W106-1]